MASAVKCEAELRTRCLVELMKRSLRGVVARYGPTTVGERSANELVS